MAPPTAVAIMRPMTALSTTTVAMTLPDVNECWILDQRCFTDGEAYDRDTFRDLLGSRGAIAYKAVAGPSLMVGFVIGLVEPDGTGHVVVLGVAPEWRRQGIARELMARVEDGFLRRGVRTLHLEVRTTNGGARRLYEQLGYAVAGRRLAYYSNGDDGYLMVKTT
jgi:ribosomal protein S18 acetylase RimI-like enzyme